ncbi:hypothetical protein [Sphaerospermopsis reniformis]|nr:hypothetical protein [Sphaerospermopsis reniformis]
MSSFDNGNWQLVNRQQLPITNHQLPITNYQVLSFQTHTKQY